jgi:hypothetical protein
MRLRTRWLRSRILWFVVALSIAAIVFSFRPKPASTLKPITEATFTEIRIGMSLADLTDLLGKPSLEMAELGKVDGPEDYILNFAEPEAERRARGFQDYERRQWTGRDITIIVITDPAGNVVCRYKSEGRRGTWLTFFRSFLPF